MIVGVLSSCVACLVFLSLGATASAQSSRTVLLLHSDQGMAEGDRLFTQGFQADLATLTDVQLEQHYLHTSGREGDAQDRALADWLQSRYRDRHFSVVVTFGGAASVFATRFGKDIWPDAPVIHAAIDGPQLRTIRERGNPLIPRVLHARRLLEQALAFFPETRQVWLISGATSLDHRLLSDALADIGSTANGLRLNQVVGLPWHDLLEQIGNMPADAVAIPISFFGDGNGREFSTSGAIQELARTANRPVFVPERWMVGTGAVGGYAQNFLDVGRIAAQAASRVLAGMTEVMPPNQIDSEWTFDANQLRRWRIADSRLPAGSIVINRQDSIWRRYRWPIVAAFSLLAAQAAIIGALLVQQARRRRVEVALRASEEAAQTSFQEARDLAGKLISAREQERARIARDLHDDIGQRAASLCIAVTRMKPQIPSGSSAALQSLSDVEHQAMRLSADLRHLSHELHPATLVHLGLVEALRERCDEFRAESGVQARLDVSGNWRKPPVAIELCLYRVAQEALRNVATHARATTATVSLDRRDDRLTMCVADDGCGFNAKAASSRSGLGLVSIGERIRMLGGALDVMSTPGGTQVVVELPAGDANAA